MCTPSIEIESDIILNVPQARFVGFVSAAAVDAKTSQHFRHHRRTGFRS
jgi:hypothetical protein